MKLDILTQEQIDASNALCEIANADCSPIHEAIVGQKYFTDFWLHSSGQETIFMIMAGHLASCSWLEDSNVRKDETFFTFATNDRAEALDMLAKLTAKMLIINDDWTA